ncbi:MAG: GGDEF domain-containing protein [candidate division NC10 bacterium]|nr:GGDEF domain-containing protein [candidate division NC10 bacterium]
MSQHTPSVATSHSLENLAQSLLNPAVMRPFTTLLTPGGFLLLVIMAVLQWIMPPASLSALVQIYPYAVFGAGLFFGFRFHRSQLLFATLVLAIADRALLQYAVGDAPMEGVGRILFNAAAVLVPLNLAGLSFIAERGLVTARGLLRLVIILTQLPIMTLLCRPEQAGLAALLEHRLLDIPFVGGLPIAQPALLAFGIAFILVTVRFICRPNLVVSSFIWALVATFLALTAGHVGTVSTLYFATAGLILVVSVIETSYVLAYRDELTGLRTRRALTEALLKLGGRYAVAMIDVDHFKKFNDEYGHDAGDQLLRMLASKLTKVLGDDKAFRYGGEEFCILFSGQSIQDAIPHLETLRRAVEASPLTLRGLDRPTQKPRESKSDGAQRQTASVTVSIGVAEAKDRNTDPEHVIKAADEALYRAKNTGRNMVSV